MNDKKNLTIKEAFNLAVQNHQNNNLKDAQNYYQKVLEIDPNHINAHNNLGAIFNDLGEHQKAKECYQKVIAIDPSVVIPNNDFERDFGVDANVGDLIEKKDNIMSLKTKELKDVASVSKSDSSTSIVVPNFITDNRKIDNSSNSSQSVTVVDQRVESMEGSSNALLAYFRQ